jgi:hypothetical protein
MVTENKIMEKKVAGGARPVIDGHQDFEFSENKLVRAGILPTRAR